MLFSCVYIYIYIIEFVLVLAPTQSVLTLTLSFSLSELILSVSSLVVSVSSVLALALVLSVSSVLALILDRCEGRLKFQPLLVSVVLSISVATLYGGDKCTKGELLVSVSVSTTRYVFLLPLAT